MPSRVQTLTEKGIIRPPSHLKSNIHYETIMGSVAYGVSSDTSDMDIYGFSIPPKELIFTHLGGYIQGFDSNIPRFEQYQEHGLLAPDELGGKGRVYDFQIYNIVKFFKLVMDNNPNMIETLFTPRECVLHITSLAERIRDHRHDFLHKGCWHKFKNFAFSQLHKMGSQKRQGKRKETFDKFGYDVKFAYHLVRLLDEVEQILESGDLQLGRNKEHLKAIRKGEVSEQDVRDWAASKEKHLENLYANSKLKTNADFDKIKQLLLDSLEYHYGNLKGCLVIQDQTTVALRDIKDIVDSIFEKGLI